MANRRMIAAKRNGRCSAAPPLQPVDIPPRDPIERELLARLRAEEAAREEAERQAALAEAEAERARAALRACLCREKEKQHNHCGCDW
ncbi:hypothetical protein [Fictibacillus terranigra]|uniref:Uncharacterized protein n=1 Tax=Fictibacillus terranigra TaxID=3058424 RepID=A0ABT8E8U3_9BACL|nr:hypothetical protein [Fictibacillus sp. CENA-BCM004]MDN4074338.1 hypothetical protein [Fictibacillus sp. CENA-BCM004]